MAEESASLIYVTTGNAQEAQTIADALVDERLVACANIIRGMGSVYRWQGEVQHDDETLLIVKTRASLVPAVTARVRVLHASECPCVVALPIIGGNPAFVEWIIRETGEPRAKRSSDGQ